MTTMTPPLADERTTPTVSELFRGFLMLGLTGFGGVLPLARRMIVEERRWLDPDEFTDLLSLCQFLPGGNIINMSIAIGLKLRGPAGALASILGLIVAPTIVVIGLGILYDRFQADPLVRHLFAGLAAAAAGLLVSMAVKIAWPLRSNPAGCLIAAACVAAMAGWRLPLLPTMLALVPVSILFAWKARR